MLSETAQLLAVTAQGNFQSVGWRADIMVLGATEETLFLSCWVTLLWTSTEAANFCVFLQKL